MDAKEAVERDFKRQIEFLNIKKYHEMGYKGQGYTILNAEGNSDHREMTSRVIRDFAPEVTLLESIISIRTNGNAVEYARVTLNREVLDLEDAIDRYNIKIITRSYSGSSATATLNYFKDLQERKGVIFFCASGNEEDNIGGWAKNDTAMAISESRLKENGEIMIAHFGSLGEVDFTCFAARGNGSSAASPALASMTALLLQRYGNFTHDECKEILKSISMDLGDPTRFGYGLPVLPLEDKLEILERLGGEKMEFTDVEQDRWSKPAIDKCVAEGLLLGFEDGTFRPTENVTREQFAQILTRILDKIERR